MLFPLKDGKYQLIGWYASKGSINQVNDILKRKSKKISDITTIGVGSVGLDSDFIDMMAPANPTSIDKAIEDISSNKYELIAVGRALISDPNWVIKMKEGRFDELIPYTKESLLTLY